MYAELVDVGVVHYEPDLEARTLFLGGFFGWLGQILAQANGIASALAGALWEMLKDEADDTPNPYAVAHTVRRLETDEIISDPAKFWTGFGLMLAGALVSPSGCSLPSSFVNNVFRFQQLPIVDAGGRVTYRARWISNGQEAARLTISNRKDAVATLLCGAGTALLLSALTRDFREYLAINWNRQLQEECPVCDDSFGPTQEDLHGFGFSSLEFTLIEPSELGENHVNIFEVTHD